MFGDENGVRDFDLFGSHTSMTEPLEDLRRYRQCLDRN